MRILLLLLPPEAVVRVQVAVGNTLTTARVRSDAELLGALDRERVSGVIIDPTLVQEGRVHGVVRRLQESRIPLLLYLSVSMPAVRAAVPLVRVCSEVILRGYDDDRRRLCRVIGGLPQRLITTEVLDRIRPALVELPPALHDAVVTMFTQVTAYDSPQRLAAAAGMTRRSLDRWVSRVGLSSARLLCAAPRVIRAYGHLCGSDSSVARVAALLGFGSARPLEQRCLALLRVKPQQMRRELTAEQFVASLGRHLMAAPAGCAVGAPRRSTATRKGRANVRRKSGGRK